MSNPLLEMYSGAALTDPIAFTLGPGDLSTLIEVDFWNRKGGAGDTATGLRLVLEASDGANWVRSGLPILEQLWGTAKITAVINTGDPTFGPYSTGTRRLGTNNEFEFPDLPANCALSLAIQFFAPASITDAGIDFQLVPEWDQNAKGLADKIGIVGSGVVPTSRDIAKRCVLVGRNIVTDGSDTIIVDRGLTAREGVEVVGLQSSHVLNQNDGAAAALTAGQSYVACISQDADSVVTVTKGTKSATPSNPAIPSGDDWLAWITVPYDAGGSAIDGSNVDAASLRRGNYLVEAGSGLNVVINSGAGIGTTSHYMWDDSKVIVPVTASVTNYIWKRPDGSGDASLTEVMPVDGSILLAEADCDGSGVTAIRQRQVPLWSALTELPLVLELGDVSATGDLLAWTVAPFDLEMAEIGAEAADNSGGAADAWIFDVLIADEGEPLSGTWDSVFPSFATDDQRPTLAWDATVLSAKTVYHEVRRVKRGQRIGASVVDIPAGGTLADARIVVNVRRYR